MTDPEKYPLAVWFRYSPRQPWQCLGWVRVYEDAAPHVELHVARRRAADGYQWCALLRGDRPEKHDPARKKARALVESFDRGVAGYISQGSGA